MEVSYESLNTSILWTKRLLFTSIFIQENKLHTIYDRYNAITSKQWLLMVVCSAYDTPPDLTTLGVSMGCSRQNVKKLADQLLRKEFVQFVKSKIDSRSVCIVLSDKGKAFMEKCNVYAEQVFTTMFSEFTDEELIQYYQMSIKIMKGIDHLEELFKKLSDSNAFHIQI